MNLNEHGLRCRTIERILLKRLETDCVCRENSFLSVDLILVSAFGIIHLGNYPLVILQSGINFKFEILMNRSFELLLGSNVEYGN